MTSFSAPSRFPSRFVNLDIARARHGCRVDRLGRHLWDTDEPADRVVASMAEMGPTAWPVLERALRGERVPEAPSSIRDLIEEAAHIPAWVDWSTCDRGGALLMRAGPLGGAVLGARSLVLGYASPGGNKPLVFSARLKNQAARRLNETARFVQAVCRPAGMRPFAEGWQITLKVRLIHAQVRKMILASGRWNAEAWGTPLNQHDLGGTTLLFSAAIIDGLRKLGMQISPDEAESYIHLWRWVGRVIGVHPDILPASEPEAMRLADLIETTMGEPDQDSRDLTKALCEAGFENCDTPAKLREAQRTAMVFRFICRHLIGNELADKLAIPGGHLLQYAAMPMMKGVVGTVERLTKAVPFGERSAMVLGTQYWDRVVELGLNGATYEFPLPKALSNIAA